MSRLSTGKCPPPVCAHRKNRRPFGVERLEERRLLTLAEFQFNFYEDLGGVPGNLLESAAIEAGDTFFVEIVAEDVQAKPRGLHGISLDVLWDPDVFSVADAFDPADVITDKLPLFSVGTLEPEIGRINDLGGSAGMGLGAGSLVGKNGPERFALIRFEALQPSEGSRFSLRAGKHDIAFYPPIWDRPSDFYFDQEVVAVANPQSQDANRATSPAPPVQTAITSPAPPVQIAAPPAAVIEPVESVPAEVVPPSSPPPTTSLPEPPPPAVAIEEIPAPDVESQVPPNDLIVIEKPTPAEPVETTPVYGPARFLVIDLWRGEMHVVIDSATKTNPNSASPQSEAKIEHVPAIFGPLPLLHATSSTGSPSGWQRSVEALFQDRWLLAASANDFDDSDEIEGVLELLATDLSDKGTHCG